jgi:hypothetical protein
MFCSIGVNRAGAFDVVLIILYAPQKQLLLELKRKAVTATATAAAVS